MPDYLRAPPPPPGLATALDVPHDNYLDNILMIDSNRQWLRAYFWCVMVMIMMAGFTISTKSMPEPASRAK